MQLKGPPLKYFLALPKHPEAKVPSLHTSPMSCWEGQVLPCTHRGNSGTPFMTRGLSTLSNFPRPSDKPYSCFGVPTFGGPLAALPLPLHHLLLPRKLSQTCLPRALGPTEGVGVHLSVFNSLGVLWGQRPRILNLFVQVIVSPNFLG